MEMNRYPSKLYKKIHPYIGPVSYNKTRGYAHTASTCYDNQVRRCNSKNNPRYKDNGAKGIKVLYSKHDFIAWYIHNINFYIGDRPSVGRIDHAKSYSFDNIRIESLADNSMERINRVGTTKPRRPVDIYKNGIFYKNVDSGWEAARQTGVQKAHISRYCRGVLKESVAGFSFKYSGKKCA